jgi:hypothetical protein
MWGLLCWLVDHDWYWSMARGGHGEPGRYRCLRCGDEEERGGGDQLSCRCLGGCKCEYPVFVFEVERGSVEA